MLSLSHTRIRIAQLVLLLMVVLISALFLTMIRHFLLAIFMAGLFSAMLSPLHRRLSRRCNNQEHVASALIVAGVFGLILVPLACLVGIVISQAVQVGQSVSPWVESFIQDSTVLTGYVDKIPHYEKILPFRDTALAKAGEFVGNLSTFLIASLSFMTKMTVNALLNVVIMLYVMFYFLTIGDRFLNKILYYLPLSHEEEERLLHRFTSVAGATMKSTLIIGLLQGLICGLAFAVVGISGAAFWGTVMAVTSIIPAVGASIVWIPALILLLISGNFYEALLLALICGLGAGSLDNLLRPRLVGKDTQMHDLFVLFGTLGGITLFGILGVIIGPIIAALFITIWELYGLAFKDYLPMLGKKAEPESAETVSSPPAQDNTE
jgi:predicted PurR-regulated permease PerM